MKLGPGVQVGPYQIVEQIGRGGMATVFKAYQPALERMVALKVLPEVLAEDPQFRERFRREAVAIAKLRHPSILTVYDHGEIEDQLRPIRCEKRTNVLQKFAGLKLVYSFWHSFYDYRSTGFHIPSFLQQQ